MARLISTKRKDGTLWNLPTVKGDWYAYVIHPGEILTGQLMYLPDGQYFVSKSHFDSEANIKAWCRLDGDMNNELVQPEEPIIVDEFLREV